MESYEHSPVSGSTVECRLGVFEQSGAGAGVGGGRRVVAAAVQEEGGNVTGLFNNKEWINTTEL